ncbi:MAG: glycosyltransferase [Patescibacteria group bacterium]|nr:glycosyltransferase [Patescibacteria group bacterium]
MNKSLDDLLKEREKARANKDFSRADAIRKQIEDLGFLIEDGPQGPKILEKPEIFYNRSDDVPSNLDKPDNCSFSVSLTFSKEGNDPKRVIQSIINCYDDRPGQPDSTREPRGEQAGTNHSAKGLEILAVGNNLDEAGRKFLKEISRKDPRIKVFQTNAEIGEAAARNISLKQALGKIVIILDASVEVTGDIFNPTVQVLSDKTVGVAGPFGLVSDDLHSFRELESQLSDAHRSRVIEVDAQQLYFMAFRRELLTPVGLMREKFKFYRHLDLDFCLGVKDKGYKIVNLDLPVLRHEHCVWETMAPVEREKKSKKNFYIFLNLWHDRKDLLVKNKNR